MKKKITRPDGTVEEYEGSAEEIARIEAEIAGRSGMTTQVPVQEDRGSGRRVLTDEIQRAMDGMSTEQLESLKWWAQFVKLPRITAPIIQPQPIFIPWIQQPYPIYSDPTVTWITCDNGTTVKTWPTTETITTCEIKLDPCVQSTDTLWIGEQNPYVVGLS